MSNYILQDGKPVLVPDIVEWAKWFETADRKIDRTIISDDCYVSTVFLGIDHRFGDGPPLLFETMIFGGEHDEWQKRVATIEEARAQHAEAVAIVRPN